MMVHTAQVELSVLQVIPVKHFDILVGMLVELADATVDVLGDALVAGMKDGLPDCLSEEHVLVGVLL